MTLCKCPGSCQISPLIARFRSCHQTRRSASCLVAPHEPCHDLQQPTKRWKKWNPSKIYGPKYCSISWRMPSSQECNIQVDSKKKSARCTARFATMRFTRASYLSISWDRRWNAMDHFSPSGRAGEICPCISTTSRGEGTVSFKNFSSSLGILSWMSVAVLLINLAWRAWKISAVCLSAQLAQQVHWTDCAMSGRNTHRGSCHQNLLLHRSAWTWVPSRFPDRNIGCQQPSCLRLSQPRPSLCWVHEVVDSALGWSPNTDGDLTWLCYATRQ